MAAPVVHGQVGPQRQHASRLPVVHPAARLRRGERRLQATKYTSCASASVIMRNRCRGGGSRVRSNAGDLPVFMMQCCASRCSLRLQLLLGFVAAVVRQRRFLDPAYATRGCHTHAWGRRRHMAGVVSAISAWRSAPRDPPPRSISNDHTCAGRNWVYCVPPGAFTGAEGAGDTGSLLGVCR